MGLQIASFATLLAVWWCVPGHSESDSTPTASSADLWTPRLFAIPPSAKAAPVVVGIWDTGVDLSLFAAAPGRGIGLDAQGNRSDILLSPLGEAQSRWPQIKQSLQGVTRRRHHTGRTIWHHPGYLRVNSLRLTRLQYSLDLPPALENAAFPSLILLSLVENAVVHGIEPKKDTGHVRLSAKQTGQYLEVTVEDDGAGFSATHAGSGLGLTNIRDRLKELFGTQARLQLSSNPGGGVTASVVVPLSML